MRVLELHVCFWLEGSTCKTIYDLKEGSRVYIGLPMRVIDQSTPVRTPVQFST
jgi:hypothetical protein